MCTDPRNVCRNLMLREQEKDGDQFGERPFCVSVALFMRSKNIENCHL